MADGSEPAQVQCDNCGQVDHPHEHCFDLYLELISGRGGGHGRTAQRGRGGKGGGGGKGTLAIGPPPMATPPPLIEAAMAVRIERLE